MADGEKEPLIKSPPRRERLASERSIHSELSVHSVISSPDPQSCSICPAFLREIGYKEKLTILLMCLITFVQCLCFSVLAPFFPKEAEVKGLNSTETGMIFGVFELMIFLTAPIFGAYLTKFGIIFTYISGCLVAGSCSIIFGVLKWCPPGNIYLIMCFLTRGVEALAVSAHLTASMAVIGFIFKDRASLAIGFIEIFSGLGMMAGPPLGGVLYALGGFGLPFWTLGGITVTLAFISCFLIPSITDDSQPSSRSKLAMLKSPYILCICLIIVCSAYCITFLDPTLSLHLENKFHVTTVYVGLIFLAAPGTYTFSAPLIGWINDTCKQTNIIIVLGTFLTTICNLFVGPAPFLNIPYKVWIVCVALSLLGVLFSLAVIPTFSALLKGAESLGYELDYGTVGAVSGIFNSCFSLGAFLGPFVGGALNEKLGFDWASVVGSGLVCVAGTLLFILTLIKKNFILPTQSQLAEETVEKPEEKV